MYEIPAIPTMYKGIRFRSRLETKWALFFDFVGWPWEYEPIDLNGYIPDFILPFNQKLENGEIKASPVLVEVKPELYKKDLHKHTKKIENSGWEHESLIIGSKLFESEYDPFLCLGILNEYCSINGNWWGEALLHQCNHCGEISFHHSEATYSCRVNGCYDGDHYLEPYYDIKQKFNMAHNATQWNPTKSTKRQQWV